MSEKTPSDVKTLAYVLRRTNYGEADRILNLITPAGKITAFAKGVRKSRAKLAGSVEMFTLFEANLHFSKKGEFATLTGAKMLRFCSEILKDLRRMEKAGEFLKAIGRATEMVDSPEFFEILDKSLVALDEGDSVQLIEAWFLLNLARAAGEQVNLYRDVNGEPLEVDALYSWNSMEMALEKKPDGEIDVNAIKTMRIFWTSDINVAKRIKNVSEYLPEILKIAQAINKVVK